MTYSRKVDSIETDETAVNLLSSYVELINASENGDLADDNAFTSYLKGLYIKVDGSALTPGLGTILYFVMENSVSNHLYFHI
ncbi:MAG: DUF4270 family protein [Crocinitomicaceae bacterium]|nr:DUF4270 family protein [Crocinitomicaceae bacterium]